MFKIDALGKACPLPVIEAHNALKEHDSIEITVDNKIATENLKRLAEETGCTYAVQEDSPAHFVVVIQKKDEAENVPEKDAAPVSPGLTADAYIVVISSPAMGQADMDKGGTEEFGRTLLRTFIHTLTVQDTLPSQIIFYNGGVPLVTEGSDSLDDLKELADKGVKIYTCGACLNYYGLTDKVAVGEVTNMFSIIEMMRKAVRIVHP